MADYYVTAFETTPNTGTYRYLWQATTAFAVGDRVVDSIGTMAVYECTVAGTSGATEPTWPANPGDTVADGTVVWTLRVPVSWENATINLHRVTPYLAATDVVYLAHDMMDMPASTRTYAF